MLPERYVFERHLIQAWLKTEKPLFGICLGSQFVNVVRGGSLIQHVPRHVGTEVTHSLPSDDAWHDIRIKPGSRLSSILGNKDTAQVNSAHHQAVLNVGDGLHPVAYAPDGIIEALEMDAVVFRLLVQWHPERMADTQVQHDLFSAFVKAAKEFKKSQHEKQMMTMPD